MANHVRIIYLCSVLNMNKFLFEFISNLCDGAQHTRPRQDKRPECVVYVVCFASETEYPL
jgi:hypothetical protein